MTIADELETVRKKHRGVLRPADVVRYAKSPATRLHRCFEWNNTKAAHAYRLWQARMLIRVRVAVVEGTQKENKVYVSLYDDRKVKLGYRALVDVMHDKALRSLLLNQALFEAQIWQEKYKNLVELKGVFVALERVQKRTRRKIKTAA